jgi:hypothetical protein
VPLMFPTSDKLFLALVNLGWPARDLGRSISSLHRGMREAPADIGKAVLGSAAPELEGGSVAETGERERDFFAGSG